MPAVNQVELHPYLQQEAVCAAHAKHGVVTEAWSPLAKGGDLLAEPVVAALAFDLDDADLACLSTVEHGLRTGPNPDTCNG